MEENQEELVFRVNMFDQQIQQIQQQLQLVEQGINELGMLNQSLDDLKESKDKEILAHLGKGIYIKAKILSEDLTVDIGNKKFVKKNIDEAKNMTQTQTQKLEGIYAQLTNSLEEVNKEIGKLLEKIEEK